MNLNNINEAFVDLRIKPMTPNLKGIRLNARQLKIFSVKLNDIDCKFNYVDPSSKLVKEDSVKSYEHINECYNQALSITDPDLNNGELSIEFPELGCPEKIF